MNSVRQEEATGRVFLFLQGPPGAAFSRLATALGAQGHAVRRINFNGGDLVDWRGPAANYRGPPGSWPSFLERRLAAWNVTDIVLFGDCRPLHRAALDLARARGVTAHVFEEGYIRPNWVTLELGGVNANSALPRSSGCYLRMGAGLSEPADFTPATGAMGRTRRTAVYYAASAMLAPAFPFYRTHRKELPAIEAVGWIGRYLARGRDKARSLAAREHVADGPFFLFPMQLDSDAQIRVHSPLRGMADALRTVIESFASNAPAAARLVIKQHPLDSGLRNWRGLVVREASRLGLGTRLVFSELGDIDAMVEQSVGVVTVNSTTGSLALAAGRPVMVLGKAIYGLPGLTHQGSLESFWSAPTPPDPALFAAFRRVLADKGMVRGGFYGDEHLASLVEGAVPRLVSPSPIERMDAVALPIAAE